MIVITNPSGGITPGSVGAWVLISQNAAITAGTVYGPYAEDRHVMIVGTSGSGVGSDIGVYMDSSNPPTTLLFASGAGGNPDDTRNVNFMIPAGLRWKVVDFNSDLASLVATIWKFS
jgi:hypothetical protein